MNYDIYHYVEFNKPSNLYKYMDYFLKLLLDKNIIFDIYNI